MDGPRSSRQHPLRATWLRRRGLLAGLLQMPHGLPLARPVLRLLVAHVRRPRQRQPARHAVSTVRQVGTGAGHPAASTLDGSKTADSWSRLDWNTATTRGTVWGSGRASCATTPTNAHALCRPRCSVTAAGKARLHLQREDGPAGPTRRVHRDGMGHPTLHLLDVGGQGEQDGCRCHRDDQCRPMMASRRELAKLRGKLVWFSSCLHAVRLRPCSSSFDTGRARCRRRPTMSAPFGDCGRQSCMNSTSAAGRWYRRV